MAALIRRLIQRLLFTFGFWGGTRLLGSQLAAMGMQQELQEATHRDMELQIRKSHPQ